VQYYPCTAAVTTRVVIVTVATVVTKPNTTFALLLPLPLLLLPLLLLPLLLLFLLLPLPLLLAQIPLHTSNPPSLLILELRAEFVFI
jgi:hypothetical protein